MKLHTRSCSGRLVVLLLVATTVGAAPPTPPVVDIFAVRNWEPPPPVDARPPPPQAPPLPFRYLGRIAEPGRGMAFMLARGERIVVVGIGDSIGKDYRVENYDKGRLLFRYRPLNVRQALVIGAPL